MSKQHLKQQVPALIWTPSIKAKDGAFQVQVFWGCWWEQPLRDSLFIYIFSFNLWLFKGKHFSFPRVLTKNTTRRSINSPAVLALLSEQAGNDANKSIPSNSSLDNHTVEGVGGWGVETTGLTFKLKNLGCGNYNSVTSIITNKIMRLQMLQIVGLSPNTIRTVEDQKSGVCLLLIKMSILCTASHHNAKVPGRKSRNVAPLTSVS